MPRGKGFGRMGMGVGDEGLACNIYPLAPRDLFAGDDKLGTG